MEKTTKKKTRTRTRTNKGRGGKPPFPITNLYSAMGLVMCKVFYRMLLWLYLKFIQNAAILLLTFAATTDIIGVKERT